MGRSVDQVEYKVKGFAQRAVARDRSDDRYVFVQSLDDSELE